MLLVPSEPLHGSARIGRLRMGWTHLQRQFGGTRDSFKDGAAPYLSNELSWVAFCTIQCLNGT
eukprot:2681698-Amphidinium_carterae.2